MRGFCTPFDRTTGTVDGTSTLERCWLWRTKRSRSDTDATASTTWARRTSPPPSGGHGTLSATSSALTEPLQPRTDPHCTQPQVQAATTLAARDHGLRQRSHAHPGGSATGQQAKRPSQLPRTSNGSEPKGRNVTRDLRCYGAVAIGSEPREGRSEMTAHLGEDESPLVVHVIPSPRGRGAQRAARILVDQLDEPGKVRHRLLGLFDGPPEVELDLALEHPAGNRTAQGFEPRLALRLRKVLAELDPVAVVAHGGDAMKYALPGVIGTGRPLVYCVIGTFAGRPTLLHVWPWRRIMARAELVVAVGDEVLDECIGRFRVAAASHRPHTERTRPLTVSSTVRAGRGNRHDTHICGCADTPEAARSVH